MKKLISISDIKNCAASGDKVLYVDGNTIITPAARDAAAEMGVKLSTECPKCKVEPVPAPVPAKCEKTAQTEVDAAMITRIVMEILGQSMVKKPENTVVKEVHSNGLQLVKGNSVVCDPFTEGNPDAKVGLKDIVTTQESRNMGAGFMTIEHSKFDWELTYEEFDYIIEGSLDITIDGKTYKGKAGDVFFIPKDSKITWSTPGYAKFFYVTYPANWAELAAKA